MTFTLLEGISEGVKARIRIASEGQGSSGYYSAEVLESYGPSAFPSGTFIVKDHATDSEYRDRNGSRRIEGLVGKLTTDAEYIAEERALYANALFYHKDADLVKAIWEDVDLSLEAQGSKDAQGNILSISPHPSNAVALVPNGGRDGKIVEFYESLHAPEMLIQESGTLDNDNCQVEKDNTKMTPEDIAALAAALKEAISPSFAELKEFLTPEPKDESKDSVSVAQVVEALIDADFPKELRSRVLESEKPLELIEDFKTIRESVAPSNEAPTGRIIESGGEATSFVSTAWNGGSL